MLDFSKYDKILNGGKEEEAYDFSKEKVRRLMWFTLALLLIAIIDIAILLLFGLPVKGAFFLSIPNFLLIACSVVLFVFIKKRKEALRIKGKTDILIPMLYSLVVLSFMIFVSISALYVGRIINPSFFPILTY